MYAIIGTGGKQYKVSPGDVLKVEKLPYDEGTEFEFKEVFAFSEDGKIEVGVPKLSNVIVKAKLLEHGKDEKVIVFKYKRKKNYRRMKGHRQPYSKVEILSIEKQS